MRQSVVAAVAAFVIGGIATGAVLSRAQPAPPPAQQMDNAPPPGDRWMGRWGHHPGPEARRWQDHGGMRTFALIYRQPDRNLAPADVQKIAEAFLLWNGNHTWKVIDVAPTADGPIAFSLAASDGAVIARFTMDPHTGRVHRVG